MHRALIVGAFLLGLLGFAGCKALLPAPAPRVTVAAEQQALQQAGQGIGELADKTTATAQDGQKHAPALPHWSTILAYQQQIRDKARQVMDTSKMLAAKDAALKQQEQNNAKVLASKDKEIDRWKQQATGLAHHLLWIVAGIAGIGMVASVGLLWFGGVATRWTIALPLLGASVTLLALCWLVGNYLGWIALGAGVVGVVAICVMIYQHRQVKAQMV